MGFGKKSLLFLASTAIHAAVVGGLLWHGAHRRESVGVTPGLSSIRLIPVTALPVVPVSPPPSKAETARTEARRTAAQKTPTPASAPENGALTPSQPDARRNAPPVYPEAARQRGVEGTATLLVRVGRNGDAKEVSLARTSGSSLLDEAALAAVRDWRFRPASVGSLPVESLVEIPIRFRLDH